MSGTRAGSPPDRHPAYVPFHRSKQVEARLPVAVAIPVIAGLSGGLWMLVLLGLRGLSGL